MQPDPHEAASIVRDFLLGLPGISADDIPTAVI
jgi:hypothetical protein